MVGSVLASSSSDCPNDELHYDHASRSKDEQRTSSNLLNHYERGRCGQHVDEGRDERDEEGIGNRAKLLEKDRAEVEDEVNTSQLLHSLHKDAKCSTAGVGRGRGELALETGQPRTEIAVLWYNGHFIFVVCNDLSEFVLDVFGIKRLAANTAKGGGGLVELAFFDPVTGRLW